MRTPGPAAGGPGGVGKVRPTRSRPDPRPARLMVSGTALAALSLIVAGLVRPPTAAVAPTRTSQSQTDRERSVNAERRVRYVRLKPGQEAPPGARVIHEAAPTPRVVVRSVPAPSQRTPRPPVARTRQSGG
jgi:hypothetical protein